ncbi:MAG: amidohydrolase family protein [candidate division NC10 bacterium]|nr:amidohydrolase family protein [candidate division NC10 bacterium]
MAHRVSWLPGGLRFGAGRIIDTHAHDVPLSRKLPRLFSHLDRMLPAGDALRRQSESAELSDLIEDMDRARVTSCLVVLHQETAEFFRLAAAHPGRLYGLAYYDSLSPRRGLEQVRSLREDHPHLILGVATAFPCFDQDPRMNDFAPLYEYCLQRDLPVQFHPGGDPGPGEARGPMAIGVLARTYPRLKLVCLHAGERWQGETPGWLRAFPNLFLEVEGDGEPRVLRALLRAFGSRNLMFGSGWRGRTENYVHRVEVVRRLPWWQRRNVAWRTAVRVYGPRILGNRKLETGNRNG